jgi:deoxyribonuclease-4
MKRVAKAYQQLLKRTSGFKTVVCLEDTVGSGSHLGRTFEELATMRGMIIEKTGADNRVGYCIDTCHAHAGGYDISTRAGAEAMLNELDAVCGLARVRVLHLNDSKGEAGSRKDRHAHIGEGTIGGGTSRKSLMRSGFAGVVNHPALSGLAKILETPKEDSPRGTPMDRVNLRRLRGLIEAGNVPIVKGGGSRQDVPARRSGTNLAGGTIV